MNIDDLIMQELEKVPPQKQTEIERKYVELYREKEHYRYDAIYQEQRAEKWQKAYEKLKRKYVKLLEKGDADK